MKSDCGDDFNSSWHSIKSGCGCSVCHSLQVGLSNCLATKNPELSKQWHPTLNGDLTPYDVTQFTHLEVYWLCNNGHEWKDKVSYRNRYINCPYCNKERPSKEYNLFVYNPELCKEWDYDKNIITPQECLPFSDKKVWWICKECNYSWRTRIAHRNNNIGCPQCSESKGEKEITIILTNNNIAFEKQKEFSNLIGKGFKNLSYDFYLEQHNLLIEYQGRQHEKYIPGFHKSKKDFERQQEHDRRKREYAQNNNIKFLEIWYWDFDNIEQILEKELYNYIK